MLECEFDLLDVGLYFLISLKDIIIIFWGHTYWDQFDTFKTELGNLVSSLFEATLVLFHMVAILCCFLLLWETL